MKMKKLLSIGALGLVLACSTSVGASAATTSTLTDTQKAVIESLVKTYNNGGNPVNNLNVNKNTAAKDIVNEDSDYYNKIEERLNQHAEGQLLTGAIENGASIGALLDDSILYAQINRDNFSQYKDRINALAGSLTDIDNTQDQSLRGIKEEKAADMIDSNYGIVRFGKNSWGKTTVSLEKNNKIIIQLNTGNANQILSIFNSCEDYNQFESIMKELGIIK